MEMDYSIHFHVWLPDTFLDFFVVARREARLDFEVAEFAPPEHGQDDEFIVILLKGRSRTLRLPRSLTGPLGARAPGRWSALRPRVAKSRFGPVLRPGYRLVRWLLTAGRSHEG